MTTRRTALKGLMAGGMALASRGLIAQTEQAPITVVVGAASSMDFTARLIAEQLTNQLARPAVVLSKLGAGQRLALGEVKRSAPDGRTLLFATNGPFSIYPHIFTNLEYDPVRDFTPIAGISSFEVAVATGPLTGTSDLQSLIEWQGKRPTGDAVFGSAPGNGSLSHFVGISIGLASGVGMTHVPYKDSGVGIIDLASGRLPMMITGLSPLVEMHKAGKIRILAVSGDTRSPLVPEVPTLKEAGVNVSSTTCTGVFGPAGMSPDRVTQYHDVIDPMLSNDLVKEKLLGQGMTVWRAGPAELAAQLAKERQRFADLVKASGYVAQTA